MILQRDELREMWMLTCSDRWMRNGMTARVSVGLARTMKEYAKVNLNLKLQQDTFPRRGIDE